MSGDECEGTMNILDLDQVVQLIVAYDVGTSTDFSRFTQIFGEH